MSACFSVDDTSRQTTALGVLVACMKSTADKDTNPLHYIYQEYDVSAWYMNDVYYELYSHI